MICFRDAFEVWFSTVLEQHSSMFNWYLASFGCICRKSYSRGPQPLGRGPLWGHGPFRTGLWKQQLNPRACLVPFAHAVGGWVHICASGGQVCLPLAQTELCACMHTFAHCSCRTIPSLHLRPHQSANLERLETAVLESNQSEFWQVATSTGLAICQNLLTPLSPSPAPGP